MSSHAQSLIADIVARCRYNGVEVSETLAAFTARMIVRACAPRLALDKSMEPEDERYLVQQCERVLLRVRDPSLETIKMQLAFDLAYASGEEILRREQEERETRIAKLERNIISLVPERASDFESFSTLYRDIFSMLLIDVRDKSPFAPYKEDAAETRKIEKEVASALESVFPRIGLKSFVTMSSEDKRAQLQELRRIVLGIRLFNKELGKGGAGINATVDSIESSMSNLVDAVQEELKEANEACTQYTEALLHGHHHGFPEEQTSAAKDDRTLTEYDVMQRWQEEIGNRRQFLSYLQSLDEDIAFSRDRAASVSTTFRSDLETLKSLVGSRTSLPKSHVYPLFEAVAQSWYQLQQEYALLLARSRSLKTLLKYKDSFDRSIDSYSDFLVEAKQSATIPTDELFEKTESFVTEDSPSETSSSTHATAGPLSFRVRRTFDVDGDANGSHQQNDIAPMSPQDSNSGTGTDSTTGFPIRMPVDSTPEFMQLPLEYQGFCPWTIVERGGLLLPGDPSLGVVQYANAYYVFVNERALQEFMLHPQQYVMSVLQLAQRQPALIYLLRLQEHFPEMNLSELLKLCPQFQASAAKDQRNGVHPLLAQPPAKKVDASTSTPTHFQEKHIDHSYEWNEWNLRRRALQIANLQKCRTVSSQTVLSNFRCHADTQVFPTRNNTSQTTRESGTNPPKVVTYLAGLRRGPVYTGKESKSDENEDDAPGVVSYVYEPL